MLNDAGRGPPRSAAPSISASMPRSSYQDLGRVDGFKKVLTILSSAAGPLWGGRDADGDDGGRLGGGCEAVSGLPLAAGRQGPPRPQVPRGAALFHGPQHHAGGAPGRVRQLEQHLETLLAAEPSGCLRGL